MMVAILLALTLATQLCTAENLRSSDDPKTLGPVDAVLVAVKSWQVSEVAPSLRPLLAAGGFAVPLQNGLEARDRLAAALGADRVVGGLCHMFSWIERPGVVRQSARISR